MVVSFSSLTYAVFVCVCAWALIRETANSSSTNHKLKKYFNLAAAVVMMVTDSSMNQYRM